MRKLRSTWVVLKAWFLCTTIGLSVLGMAGCKPTLSLESPSTTRGVMDEQKDHAHEHDHEHEHGIPDHKPKTFAAAVQRLAPRWKHISAERQAGHLKHADADLAVLLDVIRWLPELAADTDLQKGDWERVQQLSRELEELVQPQPPATAPPSAAAIDTLFAQLQKLAGSTMPSRQEPPPATAEASIETVPQDFAK